MLPGVFTRAEIDLDAIAFNVRVIKRHVGEKVKVIAVVKANAYGHGAIPVARTVLESGAEMLAVHWIYEGVELRKAGIQAPILIMGYTPSNGAEIVADWQLTPSLTTLEFAQALSEQAKIKCVRIQVHVKVDTGMHRFGIMPGETVDFLLAIRNLFGIHLEGLSTHFATADWADQTEVLKQLEVFNQVRQAVFEAGIDIPLVHASHTPASMRLPETHFDAIRTGIAIYGMSPSSEWSPPFEIHPALCLKSLVSRVHTLETGDGVSYGRTFIAQKPTRVALVPIGYGDGFHRVLSNKGSVLIRGKRAPIVGRICMDQLVVNIDGIPDVQRNDEVVVLGKQGEEEIPAEEIAGLAGTINYEVTTSLLPRVTRVYLKNGKVTQVVTIAGNSEI